MIISEFSSIIFDTEEYKYDQSISATQLFGRNDFCRICVELEEGEKINGVDCFFQNNKGERIDFQKRISENLILFSINMVMFEQGEYTIFLMNAKDDSVVSAIIKVLEDDCLSDTLYLQCSNNRNYYNTLFLENDNDRINKFFYGFRFHGSIVTRETDYKTSIEKFNDQENIAHVVSGFPQQAYQLFVGDNRGLPPAYARKISHYLSCSDCYLSSDTHDQTKIAMLDDKMTRVEIAPIYPLFNYTCNISFKKGVERDLAFLKNYIVLSDNNYTFVLSNENKTKILSNANKTN